MGPDCEVKLNVIEAASSPYWVSEALPAIALDPDGMPAVVYARRYGNMGDDSDIRYAKCTDRVCASATEPVSVHGAYSRYPDIAFGADNLPLITYAWSWSGPTPGTFSVAHCNTMDCQQPTTTDLGSSLFVTGTHAAIDATGSPVLSLAGYDDSFLGVVRCGTPDCATNTFECRERVARSCDSSSTTIGADGNPIFGVVVEGASSSENWLEAVHCNDPGRADATMTPLSQVGWPSSTHTSIAIGADDNALNAYSTEFEAFLAHCHDQSCSSAGSTSLGTSPGDAPIRLIVDDAGLPWVFYIARPSEIVVVRCTEEAALQRERE
jgi:hypothetical protein